MKPLKTLNFAIFLKKKENRGVIHNKGTTYRSESALSKAQLCSADQKHKNENHFLSCRFPHDCMRSRQNVTKTIKNQKEPDNHAKMIE